MASDRFDSAQLGLVWFRRGLDKDERMDGPLTAKNKFGGA
jgi:hypothetical protein